MSFRKANNVEPDEMAHNKPSHQDLPCLQSILVLPARLKMIKIKCLKLYVGLSISF